MIIDSSIIENGITPELLGKLIAIHRQEIPRYHMLRKYYMGEHGITQREKPTNGAVNNRIVCNHAKYITDMIQSYLVGNPVMYTVAEGVDIEALKDVYSEQDIPALDSVIVKDMSIYGRAYELVYRDNTAGAKSAVLTPENVFMVYDNTAQQRALFAVNYYERRNLDGDVIGVVCRVYDEANVSAYEGKADNWTGMQLVSEERHYFSGIPVIEYQNNDECQGDFEQQISLIDAYNTLQSDRVNDKEQFVDSFLFMSGVEVDTPTAEKLKAERILNAPDGGDAKYLSEAMTESDIRVLRDDLKEDIQRFSAVPDLSDENFGNNLSGVAIKYKLLGFEQCVKNKERFFAKGLKARFTLYNKFLVLKAKMQNVAVSDIDIVFTRNLPVNELEISRMINNLKGTVSTETLLEQLDFVSDAKEEKRLLDKENAQVYAERIRRTEGIARGGGYDGGSFNQY